MDRAEGRKGADPNLFVEEEREMEASEGIGRGNGDGKPTPAEHRKVRWVHLHGQDETIWEGIACWPTVDDSMVQNEFMAHTMVDTILVPADQSRRSL
ncbi:uncharacterized protein N7469_008151 [Penicillium citrinum]|uniref:Uncharacterized protein n=2 Tax=Penicillium TaxID=5073 RepID=A0A9W9NTD8_PENCI|nr:uncharacterized protein N7469_008151 [Penicillium citrinum]KAJ5224648.1 hypothetical protein N7469_008151 [Penicillium citrinum]KAJ5574902.1 hypothetical protein N7450_008801 [Penicillium hetheringtonii]